MSILLTGSVKKAGCFGSSSYFPSVGLPVSTDLEVVFLPIPIVSQNAQETHTVTKVASTGDGVFSKKDSTSNRQQSIMGVHNAALGPVSNRGFYGI